MKFSVIIPTYNRVALLGGTLDSVFSQTFTDYEIVVVDDGSTDGTREYLSTHGGRVRVLAQTNKGAGAARNLGAENANGDYLAFLDSDDLWFPWALSTYKQVIDDNREPGFVTGKQLVFHQEKELIGISPDPLKVESFPDYYASSDKWRWFGASSFVIRRNAFDATGGFHERRDAIAEDSDLAMKLGVEAGFVHIVAPPTFGYREQTVSLKAMPAYLLSGSRFMLEKESKGEYPGGQARAHDRWRILTRLVRPVTLESLRLGSRKEAWAFYYSTLRWHLSLGRWKYLLGFPLKALFTRP